MDLSITIINQQIEDARSKLIYLKRLQFWGLNESDIDTDMLTYYQLKAKYENPAKSPQFQLKADQIEFGIFQKSICDLGFSITNGLTAEFSFGDTNITLAIGPTDVEYILVSFSDPVYLLILGLNPMTCISYLQEMQEIEQMKGIEYSDKMLSHNRVAFRLNLEKSAVSQTCQNLVYFSNSNLGQKIQIGFLNDSSVSKMKLQKSLNITKKLI
jgi:hypothetical protein